MRKTLLSFGLIAATAWCVAAVPPPTITRALAAQEELVAKNPGDARAYNDYGNLLFLAGREDRARAAYEQAVELNPELLSARYNLALLMEQQNDLRAAVEQLTAIVKAAPKHAWTHYQLGRIAERRDRRRDAVRHYANAFRLDARLTFPDVNPSIIDSELVTEALLEVPEDVRVPVETPRIYEDPSRITGLLLPAFPEQGSSGEGDPEDSEARKSSSGGGARTTPPADFGESGPATGRILEEKDLDSDSAVGQVTPAYPWRDPNVQRREWTQRMLRQNRGDRSRQPGAATPTRPSSRSTGQSRLRVRDDG